MEFVQFVSSAVKRLKLELFPGWFVTERGAGLLSAAVIAKENRGATLERAVTLPTALA